MKKVKNPNEYEAQTLDKKSNSTSPSDLTIPKSTHRKVLTHADKSTHAEEMALDKVYLKKTSKIINVSIIVIRITPSSTPDHYTLTNSRPCIMCMHKIKNTVPFGYRVTNVYFSNNNGDIVKYKLRDIIKEKQHLTKFHKISQLPKNLINEFEIADCSETKK